MLNLGFETTATLVSLALYCLACDHRVQDKLLDELEELGELDYHKAMTAPYLDAVVQETLRLYPPAPVIDREAAQDYTIPGTDITIEKGTDVLIPVYAIHMDPHNYPKPHLWTPERFLPDNRSNIAPYTYLPFGAGPRNCIGGYRWVK